MTREEKLNTLLKTGEFDFLKDRSADDLLWKIAFASVYLQDDCDNAISRQAVLDIIEDRIKNGSPQNVAISQYYHMEVEKLPPVNPQEQKTGHWIYVEQLQVEICSCCGCIKGDYFFSDIEVPIKFCPNCGIKMVEPQEKRCMDCSHYGKLSLDCSRCDDDCSMFEPQESEE